MKRVDLAELLGVGAYISFDPAANAIYLRVREDVHYTNSDCPNVNVDYNKQDEIVGVEVFL